MKTATYGQNFLSRFTGIGIDAHDDDSTQLQKRTFMSISFIVTILAIGWGIFYVLLSEPLAGSIPLFYSLFSFVSFGILASNLNFHFFRFSQLFLILICPFLLMMTLGGFINGSTVILWALFAPIGALYSGPRRQAMYWFLAFIGLVIISGFIQVYLRSANNLPGQIITFLFVLNVSAISALAFYTLSYFVSQKETAMLLMQKNRELEQAYLQQEITLRQNEKLATLGKLSAGVAHELNNPAGATERSAKQLHKAIIKVEQNEFALGQLNLSTAHLDILKKDTQKIYQHIKTPLNYNPVTRSEKEDEIESWLNNREIEDAWEYAPLLVNMGYDCIALEKMAQSFSKEQFPVIIEFLCNIFNTRKLINEISNGSGRITKIVRALKSYSHLDKAPLQSIDIHEGLNDTLVILGSKISDEIKVRLNYASNLPRIEAYGMELNQVWTNILDNAISAMQGSGEIDIKTRYQDPWIVVEISDNGPGIAQDIQSKIFDPFFTTKNPGQGTGLGLNISYNIIVQKHKGSIDLNSKPGKTCFIIKLPLQIEKPQS